MRCLSRLFPLAGVLLALSAAAPALGAEPSGIKLVVLLAVDQLGSSRADAQLPGGLGRVVREGRSHAGSRLEHARAETCPGHATMLTGHHPGAAGIPGNRWLDPATGELVYCVSDDAEAAGVLGAEAPRGRSPRNLRVDALGDWMKAVDPESRVFAVSGKDRTAVTLAGQHPDGAYWYQYDGEVGFTTSRYYRQALPEWVRVWNGREPPADGFLAALPSTWEHAADLEPPPGRVDDYRYESATFRRTSGHPLRDADVHRFALNVYASPFLDELMLEFAAQLVEREALGADDVPDLLALGLSGTDVIGHNWGPGSHEASDGLRRLDAALAVFLDALAQRVGADGLLVALSADHGVLPIPEWLSEAGLSRCPVGRGRVRIESLDRHLRWRLHRELGPWYAWPGKWLHRTGLEFTVDRDLARRRGRRVAEVIAAAAPVLASHPAVERTWTAAEMEREQGEMAELYRRGYTPGRSGDLAAQPVETCLITSYPDGTSHGTPYAYDRAVPVIFWGAGIEAGVSEKRASPADIAPTLAARLGIAPPSDIAGRDLLGD